MIPKIIHYCWFGPSPLPALAQKCIESWKRQCSDFEFVLWNENSFDIHSDSFVEEAYEAENWAFVSDYVRLHALVYEGGVYLDTDVELLQPITPLLENDCFSGFESNDTVATGIIGAVKGHPIIKQLFNLYRGKAFLCNGCRTIPTGPVLFTQVLITNGLKLNGKSQMIGTCMLYPRSMFYPTGIDWILQKYSSKTFCVHHYMDSWRGKPAQNGRSFWMRVRLSLVFLGRNCIGTAKMAKLGKKLHFR